MPDKNNLEQDPEKRRFINEKIVKPKWSRAQIFRRFLLLCFCAVLFGLLAAVTFVVSEPLARKYLTPEDETESAPISIPKDEPETTAPTAPPETTTAEESEPLEEVVRNEVEKYQFSIDELEAMYASLNDLAKEADKGIVTIHSVKTQMDWFNNPVETSGMYAGAIVEATDEEYLILAPCAAVENADSLEITLADGTQAAGQLKGADSISGMAVISVGAEAVSEKTAAQIKVLELGNSYAAAQGDLVFACGSPAGVVHSISTGQISYVAKNMPVVDGSSRLFYTTVNANVPQGTFLLNTDGQLIGWATQDYAEENGFITMVYSLSDYKAVLEKLYNGIPAPYFGITGQEVSETMRQSGLPLGVYVNQVSADSPAYNAGIQNGDVITRIGEGKIVTMKDFQNCLETLSAGETVKVEIQRYGRESYSPIEYDVTIGAR